ncbi:hypothetical protein FHW88_005637 [Mucilaginibacter sp. SG538B]|uniref:conjugal transfer protein TraI n=1 Tax=Mucilaginibacter sp. SG538B TaxID=2587021 RepID=UPI00159D99A7|nr:conjugal transfer protein TraI [Mucilaginibacter sp. SG538B]NVM67316.1 hypothetical protein [Mucilaginibacter sp. SG538B]
MKRYIITLLYGLLFLLCPPEAQAQVPAASAFTGLIKKMIVAIDIKVQRLQNRTIALQNAEKQIENTLHLNSLNGISDWLSKEKDLYAGYYQELSKVRRLIASYDAVKRIVSQQSQLVSEYRNASAQFNRDPHFSPTELKYMGNIYNGILQESLRNLDETITVISDLAAQMDDAERLERINLAAKAMQTNLGHLRQFNRQNTSLSLLRAKDGRDRAAVKQFYWIQ